jgi:hypothetical protein
LKQRNNFKQYGETKVKGQGKSVEKVKKVKKRRKGREGRLAACYSCEIMSEGDGLEAQVVEEKKRARRMRWIVDLALAELYQDSNLSLEDARRLVLNTKQAVLKLFPGKEGTFNLILLPRFERVLFERWGKGMSDSVH